MSNQSTELIEEERENDPEWNLWSDNLSEESQKALDDELEARLIDTCEEENGIDI